MVRLKDEPYAIYQVHWTINQVFKHGAEFYLILGQFGEGTTAADKFAVALHFFVDSDRFGFMVVDADKTSISSHPLVGRALPRVDVINTPLAEEVLNSSMRYGLTMRTLLRSKTQPFHHQRKGFAKERKSVAFRYLAS